MKATAQSKTRQKPISQQKKKQQTFHSLTDA